MVAGMPTHYDSPSGEPVAFKPNWERFRGHPISMAFVWQKR